MTEHRRVHQLRRMNAACKHFIFHYGKHQLHCCPCTPQSNLIMVKIHQLYICHRQHAAASRTCRVVNCCVSFYKTEELSTCLGRLFFWCSTAGRSHITLLGAHHIWCETSLVPFIKESALDLNYQTVISSLSFSYLTPLSFSLTLCKSLLVGLWVSAWC